MTRRDDLERFYELLHKLEKRLGEPRYLASISGSQPWPRQGVYFFFEPTELRENGRLRVTRVGTHATSATSKTTLWSRLRAHKGTSSGRHPGGGNHRASVFRLHIGAALLADHNGYEEAAHTWGVGSSAPSTTRVTENALEVAVSDYIGQMPFLWVDAKGPGGPRNIRGLIESNAIALLSNYQRDPIDASSSNWLGRNSPNGFIQESGLWNVHHTEKLHTPTFLETFETTIATTS